MRSPYRQYFGKTCPYSRMRLLAILSVNQGDRSNPDRISTGLGQSD
ncbi:hypothetical protein K9N68_17880 [Kovacikia minuta CCNUW1]|nr:hypothetical protein [Kovacikia minuta]UBF23643.1 hypothetical protein K9N68_17880 [Kovacikia minuta CCNUW1]